MKQRSQSVRYKMERRRGRGTWMGRKTGLCSTRLARKSSDRGAANDTDRGLQANLQRQAAQGLVDDEPSFRCGGFMERCRGLYAEVSGFFGTM
jgi:hypothetical protein